MILTIKFLSPLLNKKRHQNSSKLSYLVRMRHFNEKLDGCFVAPKYLY